MSKAETTLCFVLLFLVIAIVLQKAMVLNQLHKPIVSIA